MKTFEDLKEDELKEFIKYEVETVKKYKEQNKISNILLFGIGNFGNKVVSKVKEISNVSKLCTDINKKWLEENAANNDTLLFLENFEMSDNLWDTNNYEEIHKKIIQNENIIADKLQEFDYIIICTDSDSKMNSCLAEAVADICNKKNKRFMICHSRNNFVRLFDKAENLSKQRNSEFIEKMRNKKYLLNEIPSINTNFVYDQMDINYLGISGKSLINTNIDSNVESNVNTYTFAYVLELNIIKMLEN